MLVLYGLPIIAVFWFRIRVGRFPPSSVWFMTCTYLAGLFGLVVCILGGSIRLDGFIGVVLFAHLICGPIFAAWILEVGRKANRYPVGHCQACGYDLTGNVSGVCSECGVEIPDSVDDAGDDSGR